MIHRDKLIAAIDKYLAISQFQDYAPLGLQVEGLKQVKKIVTGVSANMALLKKAAKAGAQMVVVHHGMFWKDESRVLKGPLKKRVAFLLENNLTLAAYHLPLDAHPVVGNNARLIKMLKARIKGPFGDYHGKTIGYMGQFERPVPIEKIVTALGSLTVRKPVLLPGDSPRIKRFGVISGGAGSLFSQAVETQLDLFITGELWEPAQALARESGVSYLALGHHNSEKPGIQALGKWVEKKFPVRVEFLDIPNPA